MSCRKRWSVGDGVCNVPVVAEEWVGAGDAPEDRVEGARGEAGRTGGFAKERALGCLELACL